MEHLIAAIAFLMLAATGPLAVMCKERLSNSDGFGDLRDWLLAALYWIFLIAGFAIAINN